MKRIHLMSKLLLVLTVIASGAYAQVKPDRDLRMNLNEDGSHYVKATFTAQIWGRYNQSNPGSTLAGYPVAETYDIGLRRVRAQFFGKVHDKVFVYSQVGINNFNTNAARKPGIFFHDVVAEYQLTPRNLQMGMGLTAWSGFARFSSPSVSTLLGADAPLYQQSTNDINDQFLRKFSLYAKGKISKLDYRWALTTPMSMSTSPNLKPESLHSEFSPKPAKLQTSGYFMWQLLDEESNQLPYVTGTYLGKKRVFNLGAGYQYQPKALWRYTDTAAATISATEEDLFIWNVDAYYDAPLGARGAALSCYGAYTHMEYGKDFLRGNGPMNPADASSKASLPGGGTAVAMMGTGNVVYVQAGMLLPKSSNPTALGRWMPAISYFRGDFVRLSAPEEVVEADLSYLLDGHRIKLNGGIQNRTLFDGNGKKTGKNANMVLLQIQIAI